MVGVIIYFAIAFIISAIYWGAYEKHMREDDLCFMCIVCFFFWPLFIVGHFFRALGRGLR